jgi:hypothetical protein
MKIWSLPRFAIGVLLTSVTAYVLGVWLLKAVLTVGLQAVPAG